MPGAAAKGTGKRRGLQPATGAARWAAVADLAARQWGVVDDAGLLALGVSRSAILRAVASSRLRRRHTGVYSVGGGALPREGRRLAAVLAVGPGAVVSYRSAAAHWDLRAADPRHPEVTASVRGRRQLPGILVHESRRLTPDQATTHRGLPITTVARTLADLAAVVRLRELSRAVERAEVLQLLDVPSLLVSSQGRPGGAAVRRVLDTWAPAPVRSELESRLLELLAVAGIPAPEVNAQLFGFEVDLLWRTARVVVEADGMQFHASHAAMERDRRRDAVLTARGHRVLRFTWAQVTRRPREVERAVRAALI